jgi:hypothetical protein
LGIDLVERLAGPPQAKERLMAVLESLTGVAPIAELAAICGVGRTRFYELRDRALCGALEALLDGRPGPRPRQSDARDDELQALQTENDELRVQLVAERVRTELASVMPHVLKETPPGGPKSRATRRGAGRARRSVITGGGSE